MHPPLLSAAISTGTAYAFPHTCNEAGLSESGFYYGFNGAGCQFFVGNRTPKQQKLASVGLAERIFLQKQCPGCKAGALERNGRNDLQLVVLHLVVFHFVVLLLLLLLLGLLLFLLLLLGVVFLHRVLREGVGGQREGNGNREQQREQLLHSRILLVNLVQVVT